MSEITRATPTPSPATEVRWSGLTHVGRVRPNNEDAFLALAIDGREVRYLGKTGRASLAGQDFVFAVSDGMGGAKSGEFASRSTVDRVTKLFPGAFRAVTSGKAAPSEELLQELVAAIHADLLKFGYAYEECAGMGATLSLCWVWPHAVFFAHIGDSRIYHLSRAGVLRQLTDDHTYVGWLRRQGELNERQAREHPRRNVLQQALGAGNQFVTPHIAAVPHQPGDRFLICSDGLVDGLWDSQIAELLGAADQPVDQPGLAQRMVEEAVKNSGRDNTTAVVFDIGAPLAPAAS